MFKAFPRTRKLLQPIATELSRHLRCSLGRIRRTTVCAAGSSQFLEKTLPPIRTFGCVRRIYPNLEIWPTGDGCLAYAHPCDDDGRLLISDSHGTYLPNDWAIDVLIGRYGKNGDTVEPPVMVSTSELQGRIDAALERARRPRSVADYCSKRLGAGLDDDTLCTLSIDSACGQDCVHAIDAGAELIAHVRMAMGTVEDDVGAVTGRSVRTPEPVVIEIVRRIVGIYWRG